MDDQELTKVENHELARRIPNYQELVEEIRATVTEAEFNARWSLVEGYHQMGKLLVENDIEKRELLQFVAKDIGKSERTIYRAIQFFKMFPDLDELPEGKNTSWNRICNKFLVGKTDDPEPEMPPYDV